MKKKNVLLALCAVACLGLFGAACNADNPVYSGDDGYQNGSWEISGKLSDYYFVTDSGELSATLPQSVLNVNYGDNVFIHSPAVVDGKGNVLQVTKKISLREGGAEIVLQGGSFFATDACGYTVEYTITLATGAQKTAQAVVNVQGAESVWTENGVTVGVQELSSIKQAKLVNTKRAASFNLADLLSKENAEQLNGYLQTGSIDWKVIAKDGTEIAIDGTNFNLTANGIGEYTVYAQYSTEAYSFVAFADVVKFYDAETSLVENGEVIGIDELTVRKPTQLLNLDGASRYTLTDLLTKEERITFENYQTQGEIVWNLLPRKGETPITVFGATVDFSTVEKANYGVYAQLVKDGIKEVVYGANVDFYDAKDDFVWTTVSSANIGLLELSSPSKLDRTSVSIVDNTQGVTAGKGEFYLVTSTGGSQAYTFNLSAVHSKEYYETFAGLEVYITFDMYMEGTAHNADTETVRAGFFSADGVTVNGEYYSADGRHRGQILTNTWYTVKMPLDEFLLKDWESGVLYIESGFDVSGDYKEAYESKLYIGNIQIGQNAAAVADGDRQVDLQGETVYDLLTLFDGETIEKIENMDGAEWKLYPVRGGAGIPVNSTVDFAAVPKGYYTVSVTRGQFVVCGTNVDFYDGADGFEWNTYYAASQAVVKGSATAVLVKDPFGAQGEYYKLAEAKSAQVSIAPAHSDWYYKQYQGQGVSLILDYYLDVQSNEMNVVFCGYTGGKQRKGQTWLTETIALDTLLAHWEALFDPAQKSNWSDAMLTKVSADTFDIYVGNIRYDIVIQGSVQDTAERLADFNGGQSYDLTNVLSQSGVASSLYENQAVTWTFAPLNAGQSVTVTGNTVSVSAVEKKAYNATAIITRLGKTLTIYTGVVDFYDNLDGLVWNVDYNENNLAIKKDKAGVTKGVVQNPAGKTGSYYQITTDNAQFHAVIAPAHTKAYYQQMQDKTFYFDVYVASDTSVNTLMAFAQNSLYHIYGSNWVEISVSVLDVLSNWDKIFNKDRTDDWKDAILMTRDATSTTIYIGNFRNQSNA